MIQRNEFEKVIESGTFSCTVICLCMKAIESAISGLPNPCPMAKLQSCLESVGLNEREVMAVVNAAMHSAKQGMCDPTVIAPDVWKIVKSVRVHAAAF